MKRFYLVLVALMLFAMSATVALADDGDQREKGGKAPEVPIALIYPAVGIIGFGLYRVFHRNSGN